MNIEEIEQFFIKNKDFLLKKKHPFVETIFNYINIYKICEIIKNKKKKKSFFTNLETHVCNQKMNKNNKQKLEVRCNLQSLIDFMKIDEIKKRKDIDPYLSTITYMCNYGSIHLCDEDICNFGTLVGQNKSCGLTGKEQTIFSAFDGNNLKSFYYNIINTSPKEKEESIYMVEDGEKKKFNGFKKMNNDYSYDELKKYINYAHITAVECFKKNIKYIKISNKKKKKITKKRSRETLRLNPKKKRQKYSNPLNLDHRFYNVKNTESTSLEFLEKIENYINYYKTKKVFPDNLKKYYILLDFLTSEKIKNVIIMKQNVEFSFIDNKKYENLFIEDNDFKILFKKSSEIINQLCPGVYRLKVEINDIIEKCKKKMKEIKQKNQTIDLNYEDPFYIETVNKIKPNEILDEYISDEDILKIMKYIFFFWNLQKNLKCGLKNPLMINFIVGVIYSLKTGYKYNDHLIIPVLPVLSRNGFLLDENKLNKYGIKRQQKNEGCKYLSVVIQKNIENNGVYSVLPKKDRLNSFKIYSNLLF